MTFICRWLYCLHASRGILGVLDGKIREQTPRVKDVDAGGMKQTKTVTAKKATGSEISVRRRGVVFLSLDNIGQC